MYVLVLGLDVLGNPFGLIRGLSEGVEAFFYEPFQVQGFQINMTLDLSALKKKISRLRIHVASVFFFVFFSGCRSGS